MSTEHLGTEHLNTEELGQEVTRAEFLGLTPEDEAIIAIRLALHRTLKETRARSGITQIELAQRIGSSQSRIAKAEAGDRSISFELLIRATIASGATAAEIGQEIQRASGRSMRAVTQRKGGQSRKKALAA